MGKVLSPWCKKAKIVMIDNNVTISELSNRVGLSRQYTSAVVNGRAYSEPAVKKISDALNISDDYYSLADN